MKHENATEVTRQQTALYALGLLTQHEAHCFELHLEECHVCRTEFGRLLLAAAQIGLAVSEKEPPQGFRERLVERIDSSTQFGRPSDSPEENEPEENESETNEPEPEPEKNPMVAKNPKFEKNSRFKKNPRFEKNNEPEKSTFSNKTKAPAPTPRSGKPVSAINAAIYVILAALAAFAFYSWQSAEKEKSQSQSRIESSKNDLDNMRRQFNEQQENTEKLEKIMEFIRKPSVRVARLKGQAPTPNNTGAVFWDELTGDIAVVGAFAPTEDGKFYQLWLTASSGTTPVEMLPSEWNGNIFTVTKIDQNIGAASGVTAIVTLESESDSATRKVPTRPWSASGRFD